MIKCIKPLNEVVKNIWNYSFDDDKYKKLIRKD